MNTIQDKFVAAAQYLIAKTGTTQVKICEAKGINSGYLSTVLQGEKSSDDVREKVADYFGYDTEIFFMLGACVLANINPDNLTTKRLSDIAPNTEARGAITQTASNGAVNVSGSGSVSIGGATNPQVSSIGKEVLELAPVYDPSEKLLTELRDKLLKIKEIHDS